MLYDVLPPLIFFASLGGITLVVSRVVLRLRRQQVAATPVPSDHKITDLAQLVGPSKKNVHVMKNRAAHILQSAISQGSHTRASVRESFANRQERRSLAKAAKLELKEAEAAPIGPPVPPLSQRLRDRALSIKKFIPSRATPENIEPDQDPDQQSATPTLSIREEPAPPKVLKKPFKDKAKTKRISPIAQAQQAISAAHHDQAEDILVPYLAKHPRDAKAYMLLGQAACGRGNWDEAIEVFEQVVSLGKGAPGARAALGHAAFKAGQNTKAIESLRRAHDEDPQDIAVIKDLLTIAKRMDNLPMQASLSQELAELEQPVPSPTTPSQ